MYTTVMIGHVNVDCVIFVYDDEMVEFYTEVVKNMVLTSYHQRNQAEDSDDN